MSDRSRYARLLAGVLLLMLLISCSHHPPLVTLPPELPELVEITDTPFFPQQQYQCGPASMAMVLGQRGVSVSPDALISTLYLPQRKGSVTPEMVATARSYGMVVYELPGTLEALMLEVAAGNPVLVLQNNGLSWLPQWHYAVVVGYDLGRQQLILRSGTTERYPVSMGLFDRTWLRGGRWGIILLPPGTLPASNMPLNYLKATYGLEQSRQYEAALVAYRGGVRRWPDSVEMWLAQANLEYRQGEFSRAETTLRTALSIHPLEAAVWNNLAYTLSAQGCKSESLEAVACAIMLAPGEEIYLDSRQELASVKVTGNTCRPLSCPHPGP